MRIHVLVLCMIGLMAPGLGAQQLGVSWSPAPPRQGDFAFVVVEPLDTGVAGVQGALDRTPLSFARDGTRFVAVAAVSVSAPDSVRLALWIERAGGRVAVRDAWLPVTPASFTTERLRVAPRYSGPLDSALTARVRDESRRANRVASRAVETPQLWSDVFVAPRESRITSPYGQGRVFNGELQSRHWGTDFDGDPCEPVRVANRGVVELVDAFYYGGNVVYVNHGAGVVTAYMHLSEALVAPGDTVERGQIVGRVGATGRVTGPHLHWSVRFGRSTVNGLSLLALPPHPLTP
jgi:murein DD-endopeptidase MepM/ murein hydrolase activator NlpD